MSEWGMEIRGQYGIAEKNLKYGNKEHAKIGRKIC
jgi:hypothetical protein